jgi:hypothetical protein
MRGWRCRSNGGALWIGVALLAVGPSDRPTVAQGIADNSFLIEEAYNQEQGVVQHISGWQRSLRTRAWAFAFTQEWPLSAQTHQLSYTIPYQRTAGSSSTSGWGDAALNYRYQLRADARVAIAPRLSVVVPTGSESRGLGAGTLGAQVNLPVSVTLASSLVGHGNAGVSAVPDVTTYNLGASVIWLVRPTFNFMFEVVWTEQTAGAQSLVLNPGMRWAHNFASGLQIVPGIAFPVGIGPSRGERGAFLYLSFEHRFRSEIERNLDPPTGRKPK